MQLKIYSNIYIYMEYKDKYIKYKQKYLDIKYGGDGEHTHDCCNEDEVRSVIRKLLNDTINKDSIEEILNCDKQKCLNMDIKKTKKKILLTLIEISDKSLNDYNKIDNIKNFYLKNENKENILKILKILNYLIILTTNIVVKTSCENIQSKELSIDSIIQEQLSKSIYTTLIRDGIDKLDLVFVDDHIGTSSVDMLDKAAKKFLAPKNIYTLDHSNGNIRLHDIHVWFKYTPSFNL